MDPVTWFELPADDTGRASEFYNRVFGWSMSEMGGGSVYAMTTESDPDTTPKGRGIINGDISPRSKTFKAPLVAITVQDIDAKVQMVKDAGGKVITPRVDHKDMGIAWALVEDTEGNTLGIMQNL